MSMGHAYKFFVFISYTILNSPLFIFLIPVPFVPFSTFSFLADNPPNDGNTHDSIPVLDVCFIS